jgi:hypothetical protein
MEESREQTVESQKQQPRQQIVEVRLITSNSSLQYVLRVACRVRNLSFVVFLGSSSRASVIASTCCRLYTL